MRHMQLPPALKKIRHNRDYFAGWDKENKPIWTSPGKIYSESEAEIIANELREIGIHKICFHGVPL